MNNEYLYTVTVTYDNVPSPQWIGRYSDALSAVDEFNKHVDWGFADEYATVNLSEPSGKMHTRIFYREGRKVVTK
jgi:hypothetical protein